ncbi:MAG: imidazoleglycerol-phosphate dehydratase HisB [Nitrospirota bacterium]|nr:imidazoleglycerol-phosphate dehydratase HisB [Nitrospirota bacterium]
MTASSRTATVKRATKETDIALTLGLDGPAGGESRTGLPFFDHMLDHVRKHGLFHLDVQCTGDLEIDEHHTVEDIAIVLGQALNASLTDKRGILRFGHARVPMDEALADVTVDLSGRAHFIWKADFPHGYQVGTMNGAIFKHFFETLASAAKMNLHVVVPYGENTHHILEAIFKAFGRALDTATRKDDRRDDVPSTKGTL